jgi:uncharacterized protein YjbI with pentapeptide repeats
MITLVIGPICLLVFFELQFLPYDHIGITSWQRVAVGIDLLLVWLFWPRIGLRGGPPDRPDRLARAMHVIKPLMTYAIMLVLTVGSAVLLLIVATVPGEEFEAWFARRTDLPLHARLDWLRQKLVAGSYDPATRKPESLWSNRLVLPGFDVIDHTKLDTEAKIQALRETISLRSRHLEGAILAGAGLRKADFTAAHLQNAQLDGADLRETTFGCASTDRCTHLENARLFEANLAGATLDGALLQGAYLSSAQLQGVSFDGADVRGADFTAAHLEGAVLSNANLQGARLFNARLQGASLDFADLKVAKMDGAQLQGASLYETQIQGADLKSVNFGGALLYGVYTWHADVSNVSMTNAWLEDPHMGPVTPCRAITSITPCRWTVQTMVDVRNEISATSISDDRKAATLADLEKRLNPGQPLVSELAGDVAAWESHFGAKPNAAEYKAELARAWGSIVCNSGAARFVLPRLIDRMDKSPFPLPNSEDNLFKASLAGLFLSDTCVGVADASSDRVMRLKQFRALDHAQPISAIATPSGTPSPQPADANSSSRSLPHAPSQGSRP